MATYSPSKKNKSRQIKIEIKFVKESLAREQMLETKLLNLQKIVNDTEVNKDF